MHNTAPEECEVKSLRTVIYIKEREWNVIKDAAQSAAGVYPSSAVLWTKHFLDIARLLGRLSTDSYIDACTLAEEHVSRSKNEK